MKRSDFSFELPPHLIAQHPPANRRDSRLLCLNRQRGEIQDRQFTDLSEYLSPGDVLVFNDTRVIPARLKGRKPTGGEVEILIERVLNEHEVMAHVRASRAPKAGGLIILDEGIVAETLGRDEDLFHLRFNDSRSVFDILNQIGHVPLPPYIERQDAALDSERYQTVYAKNPGAVAAPTAGLHFDEAMLENLQQSGVKVVFVTLHVGAGTFQPVRVDDISEHKMHAEYLEVSAAVCETLRAAKTNGKRVVAIGTTSVRALETAAQTGELQPYHGDTRLFITPGYQFKVVDALLTNFHLPESTLLMLICAFAGKTHVMQAYQHAVAAEYRFFSYGDAMWIF